MLPCCDCALPNGSPVPARNVVALAGTFMSNVRVGAVGDVSAPGTLCGSGVGFDPAAWMGPASRAESAGWILRAHSHDRRSALDDWATAWRAVSMCMLIGGIVIFGAIFTFTRPDSVLVIF